MPDRAVSEAIGFVLVFTLIVLTVSMATVFGFSTLEDARTAEQLSNTERAFDVLAHNQEDMFVRGAPSRATEIRLADATLSLAGESEFTVTIGGDDYRATTTPLVYSVDNAEIVYEHGAVLRTDHDTGSLSRDPPGRVGDKTIIHLVNTSAQTGTVSVAGSGSHLVRTVHGSTSVLYHDDAQGADVDIEIETTEARASAWERYWEDDFNDCSVNGGTLTCNDLDTEEILLVEHTVSLAFE